MRIAPILHALALVLSLMLLGVLLYPGIALGGVPSPPGEESLLVLLYHGLVSGEYAYAAAIALSLVTMVARRVSGTDGLMGAFILFGGALATSFMATLGSGSPLDWPAVWLAISLAIQAAGGYSLAQLIVSRIRPWMLRRSGILSRFILSIFDLIDPSRAQPKPLVSADTKAPRRFWPWAFVALLFLQPMGSSGCVPIRESVSKGVAAGLDCQAASLQVTMREAGTLARAFVVSTISGDGHVDTGALRLAAREMKDDGIRCALIAAIVAVSSIAESAQAHAAPKESQRLVEEPPPGVRLLATIREIADLEWRVSGPVIVDGRRL